MERIALSLLFSPSCRKSRSSVVSVLDAGYEGALKKAVGGGRGRPVVIMEPPGPPLEDSLRANPKLTKTDIQHVQEWMRKMPHLPPLGDSELVPFLCSNHFSLERTKRSIDRYLHIRSEATELFTGRDVASDANQEQMEYYHVWSLRGRDKQGRRVVGLGYEPNKDLSRYEPTRAAVVSLALMEHVVLEDPTAEEVVVVLDAANLALLHITKASITVLHKLLVYIQEAAPFHIVAVHVINVGSLVERAMLLVKPFLGKQLQQMLNFHSGTMEAFYEAVPRDILPKEYGGTNGSVHDYYKDLRERALRYRDWTLSLEERKIDEGKRPSGAARPTKALFSSGGSFKKLDID